jgi:hypothetical protein
VPRSAISVERGLSAAVWNVSVVEAIERRLEERLDMVVCGRVVEGELLMERTAARGSVYMFI